MSRRAIFFTVYGTPQPAGSKRAFPYRKKGGEGKLGARVSDDNPKAASWKDSVILAAEAAMRAEGVGGIFREPIRLTVQFYVARPRGHFGKRGLRPSAPPYPDVRPDTLKLTRGTEDALKGVVFKDDQQGVRLVLAKDYGEPERAEIRVEELT